MSKFQVAHIREQGQNMIIVFVDKKVGSMTSSDRAEIMATLQSCATSAGLAGNVVLVWQTNSGRMEFCAPQPWHPFFKSISYEYLASNVNKELTCNSI